MTETNAAWGFYTGDSFAMQVACTDSSGAVVPLSDCVVQWLITPNPGQAATLTKSSNPDDGITIDSTGAGLVTLNLTPDDTAPLYGAYWQQMVVVSLVTGIVTTVLTGAVTAHLRTLIGGVTPVVLKNVANNLVSTGNNQATALLLPALTNIFTDVPAGTGARLLAIGNGTQTVVNMTDQMLPVYPVVGSNINDLDVNAPMYVSPNQRLNFSAENSSANWSAS